MKSREERIAEIIQSDKYAKLLGAVVEEIRPGYSRVSLTISEEMVNFHGTAHGGVIFSLADIAFAAAGNSRGQVAVALNMTIGFMRATRPGTTLIATAQENDMNGPIGLYDISVVELESGELIAELQATIYRKKTWYVPREDDV